ncbi:MAG TPA: molybdopterin-dependent oxidoreductase [Chloroflexota bacterium]|nr:molybdopterin-dependent oxidoreductase [Chloroflexota bacterium]
MKTRSRTWRAIRCGASAGAIGALLMLVAQALARIGAGIPMFPDLFEDLATRAIPPVLFSAVLDTLKFNAKPLLFVGLLILQIVIGAVLGGAFGLTLSKDARPATLWKRGLLGAVGLWLLTNLIVLPLAGHGFFGVGVAVGALALNLALLPAFLLYGLGLAGGYRVLSLRWPMPVAAAADDALTSAERRRLVGGVAVGAIAVVALSWAYRISNGRSAEPAPVATPAGSAPRQAPSATPPPAVPTAASTAAPVANLPTAVGAAQAPADAAWKIEGLASEVTSPKDFYEVSKNFFSDPKLSPAQWSLQIAGMVKQPRNLNYDELLKMPAVERYETLECISNDIGGELIGNAAWKGVRLKDLLVASEPDPRSTKVVFTASDGYTDSIPFTRAMSDDNLLVYSMDGEPLLPEHGAPARLLIPGIYGMKNVKWLTKIEFVTTDFLGYWQQRGWSDSAFYQTMSRIDVPLHKDLKAGPQEIAGVAFAGDRGIDKVEVSVDGGKTWREATLKPPLGPFTWRLWRLDWNAEPGSYDILVRATDGKGQLQSKDQTDTFPNGATGWHEIGVKVT